MEKKTHIGKASAGWVFCWRGYTDGKLPRTPLEWYGVLLETMSNDTGYIVSEYGEIWVEGEGLMLFVSRVMEARKTGKHNLNLDPYLKFTSYDNGDDMCIGEFS
jgi:hypothetical protein